MSTTDEALRANENYARQFTLADLAMPPARRLAVVACMDARLTVEEFLRLKTGDAHIIRNAGGIVTEDTLRSLIISHHLLGTREFLVINHTDCGMATFTDEELRRKLEAQTGTAAPIPATFFTFKNMEENVRRQVQRIKDHPWLPTALPVRGFIYDVKSGRLKEVY